MTNTKPIAKTIVSMTTIECESLRSAHEVAARYRAMGYDVTIFTHGDYCHDVEISKRIVPTTISVEQRHNNGYEPSKETKMTERINQLRAYARLCIEKRGMLIYETMKELDDWTDLFSCVMESTDPISDETFTEMLNEHLDRISALKQQKTEYGYRPYVGPAGPDQTQIDANNMALLRACAAANVQATLLATVSEYDAGIETWVMNGNRQVTYDRWGFTSEDVNTDSNLDNASFEAAVAYLKGNK